MEEIEEQKEVLGIEYVKTSKKEKQKSSLLMVFSYTEPILYVQMFQIQIDVEKFLTEKKLQDVVVENTFFLINTFYFVLFDNLKTGEVSYLPVVSCIFSILTSCITLFQHNKSKFSKEYQQLKDRKWKEFKEFSPELQLTLTYPCKCHLLKFVSENNQCFMKELSYEKPVKYVYDIKMSLKKKILINIYFMVSIFPMYMGMLIGQSLQFISKELLSVSIQLVTGLVLFSPQVVKYLQVYVSKNKGKIGISHILKCVRKMPVVLIVSMFQLLIPGFNEHLPFVKETNQKWTTNYFNDIFIVGCRILYFSYVIYICYPIFMENDASYIHDYAKQWSIDFVLDKKGIFYTSFMICFVSYIICVCFFLLYVLEYLVQIYDKKPRVIEFDDVTGKQKAVLVLEDKNEQPVEIGDLKLQKLVIQEEFGQVVAKSDNGNDTGSNILTESGQSSPIRLINEKKYFVQDEVIDCKQIQKEVQEIDQLEYEDIQVGDLFEDIIQVDTYNFPSQNGTKEKTKAIILNIK